MSAIFSTLVLAYLQDCSYSIYCSITPGFLDLEIEVNQPCDDALWRAQTPAEWYKIQQAPSPYRMGLSRMLETNMQFTLASLKDRSTSAVPSTDNHFASFVLIHSILRDVFSGHNTRTTHGSSLLILKPWIWEKTTSDSLLYLTPSLFIGSLYWLRQLSRKEQYILVFLLRRMI